MTWTVTSTVNWIGVHRCRILWRPFEKQRDALKAQLTGVGIVPYLDRMKELAEARDEALALMKRDQPDMYRALLADQAKQDALRVRA
jgi:hypothetical protein